MKLPGGKIGPMFLDLIMPRMSGRETYERIRALSGGACPVIFMTGYPPEVLKNELAGPNSGGLVQKPYDIEELGRRVRDVLDAHALRAHE